MVVKIDVFRAQDGRGGGGHSSEMLVFTYKSTWHYNPECQHQHNTAFVIDLGRIILLFYVYTSPFVIFMFISEFK